MAEQLLDLLKPAQDLVLTYRTTDADRIDYKAPDVEWLVATAYPVDSFLNRLALAFWCREVNRRRRRRSPTCQTPRASRYCSLALAVPTPATASAREALVALSAASAEAIAASVADSLVR